MFQDKEFEELLKSLNILYKMYEIVRFVDPVKKKVFYYSNNTMTELKTKCFNIWEKGKFCSNCISMRALNENKTFVKIECSPKKVYMITATPIELSNRKFVVELLKDMTDSMFFTNNNYESVSEVYAMIEKLNSLALKDTLTSVYNRRYINEKLPIDIVNVIFSNRSISIIMADIDFFKSVNDTYGHLMGDCIIKSFTNTISQCINKECDWVARYGGEEFLICLPGTELERAIDIAELMRKRVEEKEFRCGENTIKITASFGVYSIKPSRYTEIEELIECTDKKLYDAKNGGRNKVEW